MLTTTAPYDYQKYLQQLMLTISLQTRLLGANLSLSLSAGTTSLQATFPYSPQHDLFTTKCHNVLPPLQPPQLPPIRRTLTTASRDAEETVTVAEY